MPAFADPQSLPGIGIVTPSFQQGRFLEATLSSVLDQGYPRLGYFVQDGGSTDGSLAVIEAFAPRLTGWQSAPDAGQADAINRGFARLDCEIMAYLNSDDLLLPGALRIVGDYFRSHPDIDVVYGDRILIDEDGHEIGTWRLPPHDDAVLSWADFVPQETLFWRCAVRPPAALPRCLSRSHPPEDSGVDLDNGQGRDGAVAQASVGLRTEPLADPLGRVALSPRAHVGRCGSAAERVGSAAPAPGPFGSPVTRPLVTIAVPSLNQGQYLDAALASLFAQDVPIEVFVADGGSTDASLEVITRWSHRLAGFRSYPDAGQSAAINESIAKGAAPFVTWLNSDDFLVPGGLRALVDTLECNPAFDVAYGRAWALDEHTGRRWPVWVEPFAERRLATRCIVSQPAALLRRSAWQKVGGLDQGLHMAMDYDLWWRLHKSGAAFAFVDRVVATNRLHDVTKSRTQRRRHYAEAMSTVRRHHGKVPMKWHLWRPYSVWAKSMFPRLP